MKHDFNMHILGLRPFPHPPEGMLTRILHASLEPSTPVADDNFVLFFIPRPFFFACLFFVIGFVLSATFDMGFNEGALTTTQDIIYFLEGDDV